MNKGRTNPTFLNGIPELLILRMLSKREMYGYELVKEIRSSTRENLSFGEGCVYPLLHSLEKDGHLASRRKEVTGRQRYYYRMTPKGAKKLEKLTAAWMKVNNGVSSALGVASGQPATV